MHKVISHNTIFPTRIIHTDYEDHPVVEDYLSLKKSREVDVLAIVGDGWNIHEDLRAWFALAEGLIEYDMMGLNYSPLVWPGIEHYAAGDAHMPDMQRVAARLPGTVLKHAWNGGAKGFDIHWLRNGRGGWNGTSANLAFKVGLALDYSRIVLLACPMDNGGNWYKKLIPPDDIKANKDHRHHLWKWQEIACRPVGRFVRSMSGNTADILGRPTREWLLHLPEIIPEKEEGHGRS